MSPAFVSAFPATVTLLGGRQSARTLHFFVSVALVLFLLVHVVMIFVAGFWPRMRAMITGRRHANGAHMKNFSRRKLIFTGIAAAAGAAGLGVAARLAQKYGLVPPDHGGIWGLGETLTYASQRLITRHSLAREFSRSYISNPPLANGMPPLTDAFKRLQAGDFADWRLTVDGIVARPPLFHSPSSRATPLAARLPVSPVRKAGPISPSGSASLSLTSLISPASSRAPATSSTSRSIPTGGKASTWPTPCIPKLF